MLIAHGGTITFVSCVATLLGKGMKLRKAATKKGGELELTLVGSHQLRKGQGIVGFNVIVTNNPWQLFTPLAADSESGGSDGGAVSSCVIAIDASGRVHCFSMPHLARLLEEEEEEGKDKLGAMLLPSPPLRTRPACLCLELGTCVPASSMVSPSQSLLLLLPRPI